MLKWIAFCSAYLLFSGCLITLAYTQKGLDYALVVGCGLSFVALWLTALSIEGDRKKVQK